MERTHGVFGGPSRARRRWAFAWGLALAGCNNGASTPPSPAPVPAAHAQAQLAAVPPVSLALSYEAGDSATERLIAAGQVAVRAAPDNPDLLADLALLLLRRGRETSNKSFVLYADDAITAARALDPTHPRATVLAGMILQDAHRFEDAAAIAREHVARHPGDSTGHLLLGDAHLELGDYDAAMDAYQEASDLRPDLRSYNRAAHLHWLQGNVAGAIEILDAAIDAGSPRDPEAMAWCFVDLGEIFVHRGAGAQAAAAAQRALKLVPDYLPALVLEAKGLELQGRHARAAEVLATAVDRRPTVEDLLRLAQLHERLGQSDQARARMSDAERLATDDPRPMAHYLARHGLEPARALALSERELAARRNIAALDTHALALMRAGEPRRAALQIERALALGTPDAGLHLHHGLIAVARGDADVARAALDRALELNPNADPLLVDELKRALTAV